MKTEYGNARPGPVHCGPVHCTGQLTDLRILNFSGVGLTGLGFGSFGQNHAIASSGGATFNNLSVTGFDGTVGIITGNVSGALFGPNAQNIGGTFNVTNGSNFSSTGVYLGGEVP